ncbi:MAG: response regulator transcription factor [Chloroflexota bacterium]|jgi:DNA-binding response OmpR family regulator|nr:response regulator transcription factor [Chloroflexota bacterium]
MTRTPDWEGIFILDRDSSLVILMIEGRRGDHPSFSDELEEKGYQVTRAPSGSAGLEMLDSVEPNVVVVDAASLRTSGIRICQSFRKYDDELSIILIVTKKISIPADVDADLVLRLPFTVQKLINRMRAYRPTADKYIMEVGPIELNTQTQLVCCNGQQTKLTPRLVKILQILMKNEGKIVKRNPLFTEVWETDYTGDTRTLDVHISWLRQALEEDPHHPRLIRTIRGVGYILEV